MAFFFFQSTPVTPVWVLTRIDIKPGAPANECDGKEKKDLMASVLVRHWS